MKIYIPTWVDGTLSPVEKMETHRRGLRHLAVSVFVMRGQETLIQRRAMTKYHTPGLWANACCTHPFWNENLHDCAVRRLEEELGITNLNILRCGQVEYRANVGSGLVEHEVVDIFRAEASLSTAIRPNADEVAGYRWIDLDILKNEVLETPELFTPWLKIYLTDHLELIKPTGDFALGRVEN